MSGAATVMGSDGRPRCRWCAAAPEFEACHDTEWGFPVDSDVRLFEKLCLEAFQSGLSWRTILAKRAHMREVFDGFDFHRVARFDEPRVAALLQDAGIVRHRGKIEAVINNARRAVALQEEFGSLAAYFWRYEIDPAKAAPPQTTSTTEESIALARELKRRGWKFVGPTTVYAFMQAMGLVNDHVPECVVADEVRRARAGFRAPVPG
jgi:DNA-3-methyladenine glycosylase I